jgi:hypothetical protein
MADSNDKEVQWRSVQQHVRKLFAQLSEDSAGKVVVPQSVRDAISSLQTKDWENDRLVYTFGTGDTQQNILAARAGLTPWWAVLTGAAIFGALDQMRVIKAAADTYAAPNEKPSLNSALSWVSMPYSLGGMSRNKIDAGVIRQLMEWGANPNHENGKWFGNALRRLDADCIAPFLDHGGSFDTVARVMLANKGNSELQMKIGALLVGRRFETLVGEDTLVQTQILPDTDGVAMLRTVFNFSAQRVQEIYESPRAAAVMNVTPFDHYNTAALGDAYSALIKLGGSAPDMLRATGKPLTVPAGLKRKAGGEPAP